MQSLYKRFPAALLSIYFIKTLIITPSAVDVGILLVLAASAAFHEAWSHLKLNDVTKQELKNLDLKIQAVEKSEQELRSYIANKQLGIQARGITNAR